VPQTKIRVITRGTSFNKRMERERQNSGKGPVALLTKDKFINQDQINDLLREMDAISKRDGIPAVLVGGVALQAYGSPRLTKDIDFAAPSDLMPGPDMRRLGPINFGGTAYQAPNGAKLDLIVRADEYRELYMHAIGSATTTDEGYLIATPEFLAAMKLAANLPKHTLDLKWMLKQTGLVDLKKAKNLVHLYVGGRFAVESFERIVDEVTLDLKREEESGRREDYP